MNEFYKEAATSFLKLVIAGKIDEAFDKYAATDMKHHNPYSKGDAMSLRNAMKENEIQYPNKTFTIEHALQDGSFVAVHAHMRLKQDEAGFAALHLFRFEGNRIAELWDIAQQIPKDSPNENGMF